MSPQQIAERFGLIPGQHADIMLGAHPDDPCVREIQTVSVAGDWLKFTFKKHDEDKCNYGGYSVENLLEILAVVA